MADQAELQTATAPAAAEPQALGGFQALLKQEFRPRDEEAEERIGAAVRTLAEQALAHTKLISDDAIRTIEALIAQLDKKLTEQINLIIHHADYQELEGAWRGLHHLVNNTETDQMLKIRVLNISKADLGRTLEKFEGTAWDQSPIFKKLYEEEYGQFGGEPYGCLVGDYHFDHTPPDVELLGELSKIAASAHAPFVTGASPSVMQMESWQELANPRDLTKIFTTPEYAAWRSLRESDDARYLALCMPRFLSRLPYGAKTNPVDDFAFEGSPINETLVRDLATGNEREISYPGRNAVLSEWPRKRLFEVLGYHRKRLEVRVKVYGPGQIRVRSGGKRLAFRKVKKAGKFNVRIHPGSREIPKSGRVTFQPVGAIPGSLPFGDS